MTNLVFLKKTSQLLLVEHTSDKLELIVSSASTSDAPQLDTLPSHLRQKVYIIDSVLSGTGRQDHKDLWQQILKPTLDLIGGIDYEYLRTTSPSSVLDFAKSLPSGDATVIFISGDTSINEFINGLTPGSGSITIFPIPLGTGNSFSLALSISDEFSAISKLLTTTTSSPLNLYQAQFPKGSQYQIQGKVQELPSLSLKFFIVLSWGFHALLVADSDTPEFRKMGILRFRAAAIENLKQEQRYEGNFKVGDSTLQGPFAYWLLTPSQRFEPTFEILPKGSLFDDKLYLVAFNTEDDTSGKYIIDIMGEAYNKGSHVNNPKVTYKEVDEGVLNVDNAAGRHTRFCLDGSIIVIPEGKNEIQIRRAGNKEKGRELKLLGKEES